MFWKIAIVLGMVALIQCQPLNGNDLEAFKKNNAYENENFESISVDDTSMILNGKSKPRGLRVWVLTDKREFNGKINGGVTKNVPLGHIYEGHTHHRTANDGPLISRRNNLQKTI